ncbi:hypothetical protein KGY77_10340 [Candidatus Bipolaricaulota bacterium]|nr:hypothetical protein [Candidatus Bipolaricaulota bacterium]
MKKILPLVLILVLSISVVVTAGSTEFGVKMNTDLDFAGFTEFYFNDSFSLGASLAAGRGVQTPTYSLKHVQVSAKYHAPSVRNTISFFGGGGMRVGLTESGGTDQVYSAFIFGIRINSGYGLNLIGEFDLVSPITNLTDYSLEPWIGIGYRFRL